MPGARERMIVSTALLVRERGARSTSIDDVLAHSGAPRGSVYHHFPGGRAQLLSEATDYAGEFIAARIAASEGSLELLDALAASYREQLIATDYRAGCPIVAVAVESGDGSSDLQQRAAAAFSRWTELLAAGLERDGIAPKRAGELAVVVIAAIEGAIVLARAERSVDPLDTVHHELRTTVENETSERKPA